MPPHRRSSPIRLLPPAPSESTIKELETLLEDAKAGKVVGLAYIALAPKSYTVNSVGQANIRPTLTRGMIRVLDDLMRDRIAGR